MEPVGTATVRDQVGPFFLEDVPDGLVRMGVRPGMGDTLIDQPGIEFVIGAKTQPRRKKALPHKTGLVLNLSVRAAYAAFGRGPPEPQPEAGVQATGSTQ